MTERSYDIVILGAGMAGVSAAREVEAHNQAHPESALSYIVLEAADYAGGRVQTEEIEVSGRTIVSNKGPEWVHRDLRPGAAENPLLELVEDYGLHIVHDSMPREFWSEGQRLNYSANTNLAEQGRAKIDGYNEKDAKGRDQDISLADYFARSGVDDALALKTTFGEVETGAPLEEVSLRDMQALVSRNMGDFLREGMAAFFGQFAEPVQDHISLNSKVAEIHWQAGEVHLASGEVFHAEWIIPTMSVGVLKSGDIAFVPEMPEAQADALEAMKMGDFNKITLIVNEDFEIPFNHNTHLDIHTKDGHDIFALVRLNTEPVIKVYMGGELARLCDTDPEKAVEIAVKGISEVLGIDVRPHLAIEPEVTQWGSDPLIRGGYSLVAVGHVDAREILAEPFGKVHLAGEAYGAENPETGQNYATHMAGAMFSGARAAREAIQELQQEQAVEQHAPLTIAGITAQGQLQGK